MEGNAQKMREALAEIRLLLVRVPRSIKSDVACGIIAAKAKHALAAPPRNCDVGTVDEQTKRKMEFCRKQGGCGNCPFNRGPSITPCVLAWAQMPYEEGGKDGNE